MVSSGRPDPDGNLSIWMQCDGFINWGKYCNPALDTLLGQARAVTAVPERQAIYREVVDTYLRDRPHIFLYHANWLWATNDKLHGFVPVADGLIRQHGIRLGN